MKLKQKLAKKASDKRASQVKHTYFFHNTYEEGYLAGFETARELMVKEMRAEDFGDGGYINDFVCDLGEEEV